MLVVVRAGFVIGGLSMSIKPIVLACLVFALILGIPAVALAQQKGTIQGRVQYLDATLPKTATLWIKVQDVATSVDVLPLTKIRVIGNETQPFSYTVTVSNVVAGAQYRVIADISESEQSQTRLYRGISVPFTIVVNGTVSVPQFRAFANQGPLGGTTGGGTRSILIALVLVVLGCLIGLWRWRRARPLTRQFA
jgi:hypothetical protein